MINRIETSTTINQDNINTFTFPLKISGGTCETPVVITFDSDLVIDKIDEYFIIESDSITIDGQNNTFTIKDAGDIPD